MELLKKYYPDLIRIFLAFLFGITAYLILSNGIYVFIPGTSVLTDVREIFVALAAALLGIPGGIIVAVLSSLYDPDPSLRIYITLQHIVAALWVSISYRWMYKRFSMPYLIGAWLVMIAFYYYVIYLPLFSVLYLFYPGLYTAFVKESVGFFADTITLFNGWISESLFTAFYTSLVLIALPKNLRIPWGMKPPGTPTSLFISPPTSPWYVKLQDNFLGIRITLWFMLLGYFPITTIGMAVSGQVQQQFIEQSKNIHFTIAKYFAEGLTEKSPNTILTQLRTIQPDSGYIYIVLDNKGSIVFSSNPNIESTNDYSIIEKYRATILGGAEGALYDAATGRMLAFSHVRGKEYHSVVLHKGLVEDFLPFVTVEWLQYNRLGALIILLSFAMGLIMWGVVTKPLKLFTQSVEQIGRGDLSVKVDVEAIDDEIAKLGISFNAMAANLSLSQESTLKEIREKLLIAESKQQVERQLQESQKHQTLGTLAGGIAHDFNNILGIVLANAWLVHDSVKDDTTKQKKRLQSIINAAGRGTTLVKQLLMFARKADVKMTQLNIKAQVDEIVTMLHETFPR
ncbi:MAG TPA: hypothetical protein DCQ28_14985, partial [Bacteroidetes bacterium]|nr:hypothetical protein [Bacteroidota bacterium]